MTQTNETWPSIEELQRPDAVRLHLGELDAEELRVAQAAIRYCYSQLTLARGFARGTEASAATMAEASERASR